MFPLNKDSPVDLLEGPSQKPKTSDLSSNFWTSSPYSSLLHQRSLKRSLKRNIWGCQLKSMLKTYMEDMDQLRYNLKFKVSGKILNSSTYVLKRKTHTIIDSSLEAQEEIEEIQEPDLLEEEEVEDEAFFEGDEGECYDEEAELFEAFSELESQGLLSEEQQEAFKKEKINRILELEPEKLEEKIQQQSALLQAPPKILYKKVQLQDLADALNEVLKNKDQIAKKPSKEKKIYDKSEMPFLPEKLIANAEKKRADFKNRIDGFFKSLQEEFKGEPLPFLSLVPDRSVKALVESVLCLLHLINHKKIQLWQSYVQDEDDAEDMYSENDGKTIYISPLTA
ncbi:MAG: hypothetical protein EU548_10445 [Promethearchaeota archaeon]|nr:MAG: hypothetical protein EU548_10445 [Candidatus Lokiarchaeota archaeon]